MWECQGHDPFVHSMPYFCSPPTYQSPLLGILFVVVPPWHESLLALGTPQNCHHCSQCSWRQLHARNGIRCPVWSGGQLFDNQSSGCHSKRHQAKDCDIGWSESYHPTIRNVVFREPLAMDSIMRIRVSGKAPIDGLFELSRWQSV